MSTKTLENEAIKKTKETPEAKGLRKDFEEIVNSSKRVMLVQLRNLEAKLLETKWYNKQELYSNIISVIRSKNENPDYNLDTELWKIPNLNLLEEELYTKITNTLSELNNKNLNEKGEDLILTLNEMRDKAMKEITPILNQTAKNIAKKLKEFKNVELITSKINEANLTWARGEYDSQLEIKTGEFNKKYSNL